MKTKKNTYELSFSAGALMSESFKSVVERCYDLDNIQKELNNIHYSVIPANAESSQKRYLLEIKK